MKTVASEKFRQKKKSLNGVASLVDQMSIKIYGKILLLSPEFHEISNEQSDDGFLKIFWIQIFKNIEKLDVDNAGSKTSFAASLNSVACDNVTVIASNFGGSVKASRTDILGAWALMELQTRGLHQKFRNATHVTDETQMCTTECSVDTLETWTIPSENDRQLVSETNKVQNDKGAGNRINFAQLGKRLEEWVRS